ncbi:hypothetical protein PoB_003755900 [Plakobranchus ocellatus]|uniref:Uncharacterized protein n=1 Tax=Plakobranchus ocellatus TaxID=259542 RepID=A0AAV4AY47_9GAST|nr:hypothetical protein PoB_003755900 [Plakobranchus ocellatus]
MSLSGDLRLFGPLSAGCRSRIRNHDMKFFAMFKMNCLSTSPANGILNKVTSGFQARDTANQGRAQTRNRRVAADLRAGLVTL